VRARPLMGPTSRLRIMPLKSGPPEGSTYWRAASCASSRTAPEPSFAPLARQVLRRSLETIISAGPIPDEGPYSAECLSEIERSRERQNSTARGLDENGRDQPWSGRPGPLRIRRRRPIRNIAGGVSLLPVLERQKRQARQMAKPPAAKACGPPARWLSAARCSREINPVLGRQ